MLKKFGNYALIASGVCIVVPKLLGFFVDGNDNILGLLPWGILVLVFGGLGLLIHIIFALQQKAKFNLSTALLLLSFITLMLGYALDLMELNYAKYVLFTGLALVGLWLLLPTKKEEPLD